MIWPFNALTLLKNDNINMYVVFVKCCCRATYHGTRVKLSFTTSDGVYEKWMCTFWFNPWIITSHKYVVVE